MKLPNFKVCCFVAFITQRKLDKSLNLCVKSKGTDSVTQGDRQPDDYGQEAHGSQVVLMINYEQGNSYDQ